MAFMHAAQQLLLAIPIGYTATVSTWPQCVAVDPIRTICDGNSKLGCCRYRIQWWTE